jgi:hypothetical protein
MVKSDLMTPQLFVNQSNITIISIVKVCKIKSLKINVFLIVTVYFKFLKSILKTLANVTDL